jgi:hexosaminidase
LVVGKPNLEHPNAQLDITKDATYDHVGSLIGTVDRYFGSSIHHFGGDEVAYIWQTDDDNELVEMFLGWLKSLCPSKMSIIWDDPVTDKGKCLNISKDWVVQTWHDGVTEEVLDRGHRVIVSEADSFYIGNSDYTKVSSFEFPAHRNVLGFEIVWFTSKRDNPTDIYQSWLMEPIKAASRIRKPSQAG